MPSLRRALLSATAPTVWDPHPRGAPAVAGVRALTPNEAEVHRLAGGEASGPRLAAVAAAARRLRRQWGADAVAVTLGGDGALLSHGDSTPLVLPAPASGQASIDTCGAGDRFAGALAGALARGALLSEAVGAAASAFVNAAPARAKPSTVGEVRARGVKGSIRRIGVSRAARWRQAGSVRSHPLPQGVRRVVSVAPCPVFLVRQLATMGLSRR